MTDDNDYQYNVNACQGQIDFLGGHNGNKYLVTFLCYLGYINLCLPHHMLCTVYSIPNKAYRPNAHLLYIVMHYNGNVMVIKVLYNFTLLFQPLEQTLITQNPNLCGTTI